MEAIPNRAGRTIAWQCRACFDAQPARCSVRGCYTEAAHNSHLCAGHFRPETCPNCNATEGPCPTCLGTGRYPPPLIRPDRF